MVTGHMMPAIRWLLIAAILCSGFFAACGSAAGTANATSTGYIIVTKPASADFFTNIRSGSAPFTVSFSDSSLGREPLSYS